VTDENRNASPWLPNLVGGISIWKLARDLNEAQFFDGRLLVPETEGTDALPTTVRWDVTGLLPLPEARRTYPAEVEASIRDFLARLEKVAAELSNEGSGYHKFKEAFTVPALDASGGAHYFYDERTKKLCLINWGASPRTIAGQQELIFGWGNFGKLIETAGPLGTAAAAAAAVAAAAPARTEASKALAASASKPEEKKEKKDEKKDEKKPVPVGRPWWHWLLVLIAILALLALLLFLFRDCSLPGGVTYPEGGATSGDAMTEGGATDGMTDAGADGDAATDALADGRADGGDGAADGASDATPDGPRDGAADARADARADGGGNGAGPGGPGGPGGGGPGGGGGGPGSVVPSSSLPHRFHFEPSAVRWRIVSGQSQLDSSSPVEGSGQNFEVILTPGGSFDKVKVQWQDPSGRWHE
jgi:hypothetical protein